MEQESIEELINSTRLLLELVEKNINKTREEMNKSRERMAKIKTKNKESNSNLLVLNKRSLFNNEKIDKPSINAELYAEAWEDIKTNIIFDVAKLCNDAEYYHKISMKIYDSLVLRFDGITTWWLRKIRMDVFDYLHKAILNEF